VAAHKSEGVLPADYSSTIVLLGTECVSSLEVGGCLAEKDFEFYGEFFPKAWIYFNLSNLGFESLDRCSGTLKRTCHVFEEAGTHPRIL
jgi:hypothetical protein